MLEFGYIKGNGVGPELIDFVLDKLKYLGIKSKATDLKVDYNNFDIEWVKQFPQIIKGPNSTPYGYKSVNFLLRKSLDLAVNIRPANNIIVLRENTQDIYVNEEYGYGDVAYSKKLLTHSITARFADYCAEFVKQNKMNNVTTMVKDNLLSDKYFADHIKQVLPITKVEWQDSGLAKLSVKPDQYQVLITPNIVGDIASDITTHQEGNIAYGASVQVGPAHVVYEPVHGTANKHVGKDTLIKTGMQRALAFMLYNNEYVDQAHELYKDCDIIIPILRKHKAGIAPHDHVGWDILVHGDIDDIDADDVFIDGNRIDRAPNITGYYKLRFFEKDITKLLHICKTVTICNIERLCNKQYS